jgi:hypothetical protein
MKQRILFRSPGRHAPHQAVATCAVGAGKFYNRKKHVLSKRFLAI